MTEVEVAGVGHDARHGTPLLLLRERGHTDDVQRYLPIEVGEFEARAVLGAREETSRPSTHRLLLDVVVASAARLDGVRIDAIVDGQVHATLVLTTEGGETVTVPARASDAVALAEARSCPIEATEEVLAAAIPVEVVAGEPEAPVVVDPVDVARAVDELRSELRDATADDFDPHGGPAGDPDR